MASRLSDSPAVAIFPWGDVIEDFLDPLDLALPDFLESMSGGWLFGYVAALRSAGCRPFVVCASRALRESERRIHRASGAPVWVVPGRASALPYSSRRSLAQWWRTPWRGFATALRSERCEALIVQEYEYARYDMLAVLGARLGLPVFATFQGGDQTLSTVEAWLRPWTLRLASGLVIASSRERDRVAAAFTSLPPVAAIPNPIAVDEWRPVPRGDARRRLGLPPDLFLAVTHGRIDIHRKGLDVLVDAWRRFSRGKSAADCRLVIVGSGQDNERFAAILTTANGEASIDWRSRYTTDRDAIRDWLSAANLYVSASRVEGMPVAPLEAMACGLPVVATHAQGLPDIFERGEADGGILVPCDDAGAIATAIARVHDDTALAGRLGAAGRGRVEAHFGVDAVGRRLAAFLSETTR